MGGAVSSGVDNDDLIDNLLEGNYIKTEKIQRVFRAVDRAMYFLPESRQTAYRDSAWKEGHIHLSAPCIYAEVMESLNLAPGMSFLNIGSGTGYLSTLVGCVLGENGVNHGIERIESNVKYSNERLQHFWKTSVALRYFDFTAPKFMVGNGFKLSTDFIGRYDRMYVGSACSEEEEVKSLARCLKTNGTMIVPFNDHLPNVEFSDQFTLDMAVRSGIGKAGTLIAYVNDSFWELVQELQYLKYERPRLFRGQPRILSSNAFRVTRVGPEELKRENLMQCSFASLVVPSTDSEYVALPRLHVAPLKYTCRTVVVRAMRNRILHETPELHIPRAHNKHTEPRRRPHRVVFPLLIAQNDADDEPQIVLGNPIHSNDNGNDAPLPDELANNAGLIFASSDDDAEDGSTPEDGLGSNQPDQGMRGEGDGFPCSSGSGERRSNGAPGNSSSSSANNRGNDADSESTSDDATSSDEDTMATIAEERSDDGAFSPGTRRLFRKRRLSARPLSDVHPAESSSEAPKRRSMVQVYLQGRNARSTSSASTSVASSSDGPSISVTAENISGPNSSPFSFSGRIEGPPGNRIITSAPPLRTEARQAGASSTEEDSFDDDEPSVINACTGACDPSQPVPASILMESQMTAAVKSLVFYPPSFQRYLNFDRPL